jgi:hypothetical protein
LLLLQGRKLKPRFNLNFHADIKIFIIGALTLYNRG